MVSICPFVFTALPRKNVRSATAAALVFVAVSAECVLTKSHAACRFFMSRKFEVRDSC